MLLRGLPADLDLFLIDFGLSHFENFAEEKGVDLYVLERAIRCLRLLEHAEYTLVQFVSL
jgi:tRNA A-37 threonylcarbamoyl transferase component Bud32